MPDLAHILFAQLRPIFTRRFPAVSLTLSLIASWSLIGCTGIVVPSAANRSSSALSVTVSSLPQAKVRTSYAANLTAAGGQSPYTWSLTSGSLPAGLSLDPSSGIISGMPSQAGTSAFGVQVKDSSSTPQTATQNLSLTVASTTSPVSISTSSLSPGQQGSAYSAALSATGGTTPYTWGVIAGQLPAGLTLNASTGQITGTPTQAGISSFTVQVQDSSSPAQTATQALSITITASTTAALSISTTSLPVGQQSVAYSSSLSASGGTAPYTWSIASGQLPAGITLSASGALSGTPTAAGTAYFTVKVADSSSPTQTVSVNLDIVVDAALQPLQITTSSLPAAETSTAYSASVAASGGTAPYTWTASSGSLPTGLSLSSAGQITGTPTQNGSFTFTVEVTDSTTPTAQTTTKSFTLIVALKGGPLQVTTVSFPSGQVGVAYSAPVSAIGGVTPYTWSVSSGTLPAGLLLSSAAATISGTPTGSGSFTFTLQVKDSSATPQTASQAFTIVIVAAIPAVQISTTSLAAGQVSSAYAATLAATGGKTPYTWSITTGSLPAGLALNASTGQISGTPTQSGTATFTVQVKDSSTTPETATQALSIAVTAAVTPVSITTSTLANGTQGTAYSATLAATGGTTPYSWSISSGTLPTGLTLNASSGLISGTPTASGTSAFTIKVTDSTTPTAQTATKSLSITVSATVTPVTIGTSSLANGQQGTAYSATVAATGGTTPYGWSISSGTLPTGLTLNASSGLISGTPTASGTSTFTIKVTDSTTPTAQTATQSLSITVSATVTPVTISTSSLANGQQGTAYSATLGATGGTTPYTWSLSSGALPIGLSLSSAGVISGMPTGTGTSTFTIKVTDSTTPTAQTATKSLSITVSTSVTPVTITTTSLASGQQGTAYSATLAASGGTTPYSWSLLTGVLPAGLTLNASTGQISGTPTGSGSFSFTAQVTDSTTPTAQTATKALSITVSGPTTLSIATSTLSNATEGSAYSATLTATGGTTPYAWSIASGSLPAGLTLAASTGVISGTPTAAGTSTFTVKVTDSTTPTAQTATASLSLSVTASSGYSVLLDWTASPSTGATGYNVYRSNVSGGPYQLLTPTPVSGLSYVDTSVADSITYYYVTTAVDDSGDESGYSPEFSIAIP
jgi:Putative Ig domain